jgi:hypothetical protein
VVTGLAAFLPGGHRFDILGLGCGPRGRRGDWQSDRAERWEERVDRDWDRWERRMDRRERRAARRWGDDWS